MGEGESALSPKVCGVQGNHRDRLLGISTGSQETASWLHLDCHWHLHMLHCSRLIRKCTQEAVCEGESPLSLEVRGVQGDQRDLPLGMSTGSQESAPPGCTCTVTGTCTDTKMLSHSSCALQRGTLRCPLRCVACRETRF